MTMIWTTIGVVALLNFATKAVGPVVLADRRLPDRLTQLVRLLSPALLSGLIIADTLSSGQALAMDARLAGVAAAGVAIVFRAPLVVVIVVAPVAAAVARAVGWS
jgi:branched-subunit amino acid transport protein